MAFTNFGYFNQSSGGAPTLSGTAGDLYTLIRYACLTISNWASLFTTGSPTFATVLQPAAGGALPVITVQDNATTSGDARLATVRLAESASSSTAYTDPTPTVAQVSNAAANWMKSTIASATTRDYHCAVWETGLLLAVKVAGNIDQWEIYFIGKCFQLLSSVQDPYPWALFTRNSSLFTITILNGQNTSAASIVAASGKLFFMRNAQGTIKSEQGNVDGNTGNSFGNCPGTAAAGGAYLSSVNYKKTLLSAGGSATTTPGAQPIVQRLCVPQLYAGMHSGYSGITETDNINNGSHTLQLLRASTSIAVIMETSNTFSGYPAG